MSKPLSRTWRYLQEKGQREVDHRWGMACLLDGHITIHLGLRAPGSGMIHGQRHGKPLWPPAGWALSKVKGMVMGRHASAGPVGMGGRYSERATTLRRV